MPLYGRLADALGRKKVILFSIGMFCTASVFAAASHTMFQLIIFRGLQGLGAGGIMPVVLTILGDIFTLKERAAIQGFFSAVWGCASLAGPALGAFLVNTLGWRSIFFVNLPFGAIGMIVLAWKYHDREKSHSTDLDLPGVVLLGVACTALLLLVSRIGPDGWPWQSAVGLAVIALGTVGWFIHVERRASNPVMPPSLMGGREIGPSMIGSCLLGIGFLSLDTYVPLYVQGAKGGGAAAAASVVTPVMLAWATSGIICRAAHRALGISKNRAAGMFFDRDQFCRLVHLRGDEFAALGHDGGASHQRIRFRPGVDGVFIGGAGRGRMATARHYYQQHSILPHDRRSRRHRRDGNALQHDHRPANATAPRIRHQSRITPQSKKPRDFVG